MGQGYTGFYCDNCAVGLSIEELKAEEENPDWESKRYCEECKPELFAKISPQITIKTYQDSKGKNVLTSKQQEFLLKLVSLCAEYEVVFWSEGGYNDTKFYQIEGETLEKEPFFKSSGCRYHDDVSDDYNLMGTDKSYSLDDIELRATRECCVDMKTETTVLDAKLGKGYTTCQNCGIKRDWR